MRYVAIIEVHCLYVSPQIIINFRLVQISAAEEEKKKEKRGQDKHVHTYSISTTDYCLFTDLDVVCRINENNY